MYRRMMSLYPPYLGAGVSVDFIRQDWKEVRVSMALRWYNRNAVGTHFGGSLYSMIDPHLMLMLMRVLGKDYIVWDKSAAIDFVKPGKSKVFSTLRITDDDVATILANTQNGEKYLPEFEVQVKDVEGRLVAGVQKQLYVRQKRA